MNGSAPIHYAGFWIRFVAALVDLIFIGCFSAVQIWLRLQLLLEFLIIPASWLAVGTTPGKWICRIRIVNADNLGRPSRKAFGIRILGYFLSWFAFWLGFAQIGFLTNKRGFHDRFADTSVIYIASLRRIS